MDQMVSPASPKYNIGGYAILEGPLDVEAYQQAVRCYLQSQEAFATTFRQQGDAFEAVVDTEALAGMELRYTDFSNEEGAQQVAEAWMEKHFAQAFNPEKQLLKLNLIKVGEELHYWFVNLHHLIADGWSFMLLLNGVAANYSELTEEEMPVLSFEKYSDYATADAAYYASDEAFKDRAFWLEEFKSPAPLLFREQYPLPEGNLCGAATLKINAAQAAVLQLLADEQKVSLFQLVLSTLTAYFGKRSGNEAITIGMPVLNRTRKPYRSIFGVFMNLVAVKIPYTPTDSFADLLPEVKGKMRQVLRHQRYQYGNLMKDLGQQHRKQLYDIRISYESFDYTSEMESIKATAYAMSNPAETDPLSIYMREYHQSGFDVRFVYNQQYLSHEDIVQIKAHLTELFDKLSTLLHEPLYKANYLSKEEEEAILFAGKGPVVTRSGLSFFDAWQETLSHFGNQTAVVSGNTRITYRELHRRAAVLAAALQAKELREGDRIALLPSRNEDMIIGIWACLFAGLTYVPIDADYPEARIRYMLQDSDCKILLYSKGQDTSLAGELPTMAIDTYSDTRFVGIDVSQDLPAYIIYTSGSTGQPKGVLISQSSLLDYALSFRDYFALNSADRVVQQAAIGFDTSVEEIFPILLAGGQLHILPERRDLDALHSLIETQKITLLSTNPQAINYLNTAPFGESLRILISGGDELKPAHVSKLFSKGLRIFNTYGPTESTVCASFHELAKEDKTYPIGHAITNRELLVLDEHGQLLPFGSPGELCIGGEGLALRYINQPAVTAEKFIAHPYAQGKKLYRSGDLASMSSNGEVSFLGRIDAQVSLRGYRIETREVEKAIQEQAAIKEVIADVREHQGYPVLAAWYQSTKETIDSNALRKSLSAKLPDYMIPTVWIALKEIPLLPNGKINRKALFIPSDFALADTAELTPPQSPEEETLLALWGAVLPQKPQGTNQEFFSLGGHSLSALQLMNRIKEHFGLSVALKDLFEHQTIAAQASLIANAAQQSAVPGIRRAAQQEDYPLTSAQHRLWVLSQLEEASEAYHISGALRLKGSPDIATIRKAVAAILRDHEALRTVFTERKEGQPRQRVLETIEVDAVFAAEDHSTTGNATDAMRTAIQQSFDLHNGPLLRIRLIKLNEAEHVLLYVLHHIISDGWTLELLRTDFLNHYAAGGDKGIAATTLISFKDYACWYEVHGEELTRASEGFWKERFKDGVPLLELPVQMPRPAIKGYRGVEFKKMIPAQAAAQFKAACQEEGATLFMGLFATLNALLFRYTAQTSTVVGTPVANREQAGLESTAGLFLNILPVRTDFEAGATFSDLLRIQKTELLDAFRHGDYPLDELISQLDYTIDPARSPLFDVLIVLHNQAELSQDRQALPGNLSIAPYDALPKESSQFDLVFSFLQEEAGLSLSLEYNTEIFEGWFADQITEHFIRLMEEVAQQPAQPLAEVMLFSESEYKALQNGGYVAQDFPKENTPVRLLSKLANARPEATALTSAAEVLNYETLYLRALNVCAWLQEQGVEADDTVGLSISAGPELPVIVYGIWLAGAVYVPINPTYPRSRRETIAEDAVCALVIQDMHLSDIAEFEGEAEISLPQPEATAYILYTSGTSGKPKGVPVSHAALADKMQAEVVLLDQKEPFISCLITNYSFDVSLLELFLPLYTGGSIFVPEAENLLQYEQLAAGMIGNRVNILQGTPTYLEAFLRYLQADQKQALNKSLKLICSGGESLNQGLLSLLQSELPAVQVNNHYGPTECTVDALVLPAVKEMKQNSIGWPMRNTSAFVLSNTGSIQPDGVPGELHIGGKSLAEGYLNRPGLSEQQFISHPLAGKGRLYKTGDLALRRPDGQIVYLGRCDEQVKIRGMRIELGDITRHLEAIPGVEQAVVITHTHHGNTLLAGFVTGLITKEAQFVPQIKKALKANLPDYMIPQVIIGAGAIPLNANGKADHPKLRAMIGEQDTQEAVIAPATGTEAQLLTIWQGILGKEMISTDASFFDLGGNSILLVRMRAEIRKTFEVELEVKDLFRLPSITALAAVIDDLNWVKSGQESEEENEVIDEVII